MLDVADRCWTGTSNNDASREWHRASNSFRVSLAANPYLTRNLVLSNDVSVSGSGEAVTGNGDGKEIQRKTAVAAIFEIMHELGSIWSKLGTHRGSIPKLLKSSYRALAKPPVDKLAGNEP